MTPGPIFSLNGLLIKALSIADCLIRQRMDHGDPQLFAQLRWGSEFCNKIRMFLAWGNRKYTDWAKKLPKWKDFSSNTKRFPPAGAGHWLEVTGVDNPGAINSCRTIPTTLTLCRHKHKHRSASVCQQKSQQVLPKGEGLTWQPPLNMFAERLLAFL